MVSKVDHTVDYGFKSWPYYRLWFQKLTILSTMLSKVDHTILSTVEISKRKSQLLQLVDYRFFVDFAVNFSSDFSGKVEEFVQNGLKIFKIFRQSQRSTTWPIRDPTTVDFPRESWPYCRLWFQKLTILDTWYYRLCFQKLTGLSTSQKKSCKKNRFMTKSRLSTSRLSQG
jgi:hypothetical protein